MKQGVKISEAKRIKAVNDAMLVPVADASYKEPTVVSVGDVKDYLLKDVTGTVQQVAHDEAVAVVTDANDWMDY